MDEECDFDMLSAMVESDGEFENLLPEVSSNNVKPVDDMDSSDDDDIAEDDLDRLACLVEEESYQEKESQQCLRSSVQDSKIGVSNTSDNRYGYEGGDVSSKENKCLESEEKGNQEKAKADTSGPAMDNEDSKDAGGCDEEEESGDEDLSVQLRMMQEQMKLLETKIKKKKKPIELAVPQKQQEKKKLTEINMFEVINNDNQQPWQRKKTQPPGTSNSVIPKTTKLEDKVLNTKLKNTVEKMNEKKLTKSAGRQPSGGTTNPDSLEKDLFGDDSGSDWEDLDGEKNVRLTKQGQEMKKIIKKSATTPRVAHEPAFDQEQVMAKKHTTWQSSRPSFYSNTVEKPFTQSEKVKHTASARVDHDFVSDPFSGIRIINPLISSLEMKSRMAGRRLIRMSHLYKKVNTSDTDSDWVTMGVLVSKSEPKMSSKGTQYSIWKLSDLEDCDKLVTLMLFGSVHKDLWKSTVASVIGLLNPAFLKNTEKYQKKDSEEVTLTIDSSQKAMFMGASKDFGTCSSKTKAGRSCNNVINRSKGEFCSYHVQAAYKKISAKRSELQAGFSGVTPKSFEKKLFGKGGTSTVYYGGQSYTTGNTGQSGKKKDRISLKELQHHTQKKGLTTKVTTLQVKNLASEPHMGLQEREKLKAEKNKAFHDLLTTPTIGSINFVQYLSDKDNIRPLENKKTKQVVSVSAREFLNNSQKEIKNQIDANKSRKKLGQLSPSEKISAKDALKKIPCLGRGMSEHVVEFDMDSPPNPAITKMSKEQFLAKRKAIAKVSASGGIKKEDPNAVKALRSPETQAKLKRRLEEADMNYDDEAATLTPSKKRSRLLGDLDMDDPNVRKMLGAKSAHSVALTEEEQEKQNQYFEVLEKKEAMEEKMGSITKVKCKAVTCKKCKYTAFSASQLCKDEGHRLSVHDAVKRFFKCKTCKHRSVSLDKLPKFACKNCGSSNFERTAMMKEKKGPTLPGEQLLLRGEERKFVNSMQ